ncbi:LPXTG cell wall anchor domain-containing protein [Dactylosporangium vinaceum]|uniref:LPXTG cell wall anchor domain-containing protein n=1 Tax=Dactylosporangium vinaceum TaxID=53362 RepID=A0ABV5MQF8_9ACTN|nr:LPXTG cell wall anchor domain-containing protein [Dactylosporangium vinaceum]UAB96477.1 LPXTG cell wall anchor domain-containing protein [Dactylosporangium vinaceum]
MKLRGIKRIATATAATALLIGALGTPARAVETSPSPAKSPAVQTDETPGDIFLDISDDGVYAATAPNKGCTGIDTGVAVAGTDGWLFGKPALEFESISYALAFGDEKTGKLYILYVTPDGNLFQAIDGADEARAAAAIKSKRATLSKRGANAAIPAPPAGWTAALTKDGVWAKTPAGLVLITGIAFTDPEYTGEKDVPFQLVRACPQQQPNTSPSPSLSATPVAHPGPGLPVTGDNVGMITGAGVALLAAGLVLFFVYRRRKNVKFVA